MKPRPPVSAEEANTCRTISRRPAGKLPLLPSDGLKMPTQHFEPDWMDSKYLIPVMLIQIEAGQLESTIRAAQL